MKSKLKKNTSVGTRIIEEAAPPTATAVYTVSLKYSSDNTIQNL